MELQRYTQYLSAELLWELGHIIHDKARYVNMSGWQGMTTVRRANATFSTRATGNQGAVKISQVALRSFSLAMGDRLVGLDLSRSNVSTDPLQMSAIRFFALASLNISHSPNVRVVLL